MTVKANWYGPFVEDHEENRAYVTREDALKLAEHFELTSNKIMILNVFSALVSGILIGIAIMMIF